MRFPLLSAAVVAAFAALSAPAFADGVTGTVASFDPATRTLVMSDRTVWLLGDAAPATLAPGQRVTIVYRSAGEDGLTGVARVTVD
ncbi:hypothetical protein [Jannaschia sp. W003]|uniref:hypothetical protein n=1 Tax=Jannaschia sp. W003 TaxID=2867012 RepID=UPI0021A6939C|nr:hypothetical protein [Jannaschia sp. W003]UWQ21809.1 hypothetical protein K3554_01915 [Jannaschia sp. W003]